MLASSTGHLSQFPQPTAGLSASRFCLGQPPSDLECYAAALIYAVIYASRWGSRWGSTGWTNRCALWQRLGVRFPIEYIITMLNNLISCVNQPLFHKQFRGLVRWEPIGFRRDFKAGFGHAGVSFFSFTCSLGRWRLSCHLKRSWTCGA